MGRQKFFGRSTNFMEQSAMSCKKFELYHKFQEKLKNTLILGGIQVSVTCFHCILVFVIISVYCNFTFYFCIYVICRELSAMSVACGGYRRFTNCHYYDYMVVYVLFICHLGALFYNCIFKHL